MTRKPTQTEFTALLAAAKYPNPLTEKARVIYLALPEDAQRGAYQACSGLFDIPRCGVLVSFEIMVAVAHLVETRGQPGRDNRRTR